jgi:hypothetical protein
MGVYAEVQEFVLAHRPCARPRHGGAGPPTVNRYRLIVVCGCGAEFKRWDKVGRSERNRPALSCEWQIRRVEKRMAEVHARLTAAGP